MRFDRLVHEGRQALREGNGHRAVGQLTAALTLWRGPPLAEFAGREFADVAVARLEELRLGAVEDRIDADLQAGRHRDLVAELERLIADHPLRERLRGQLMLALARAGRQADALQVFHDSRRVLDEELGIDPGRELVSVYETLLRQEDEPPPAAPAPPREPAPTVLASVLPRPLSNFVGRDDDLDRIVGLLDRSRLVTLTGPGGVGKTRLAIESASRTLDTGLGAEGVWLVELAGLQDPDLLADTVAETLGLADEAGLIGGPSATRDAGARLIAALHQRRALLVLDNCEHLVDAVAAFVRDLLGATVELTVLCTSREALGITGETVWSVPSLTLPPPGQDVHLDDLRRWGATALFLDRVYDADPRLVVDDGDARAVVEVCRRLDGVPLALELASARVRTPRARELAGRLDDRFVVLTGGDRTAQSRQQTLEAVIGWSWDLLDEGPPDRRPPQRRARARRAGGHVRRGRPRSGRGRAARCRAGTSRLGRSGPARGRTGRCGPCRDGREGCTRQRWLRGRSRAWPDLSRRPAPHRLNRPPRATLGRPRWGRQHHGSATAAPSRMLPVDTNRPRTALSALGIDLTADRLLFDGTSYDLSDPAIAISVQVGVAEVDPDRHLVEDGDPITIEIDTGR